MDFSPFGLTWSDLAGMVAVGGALLLVIKRLIIPWFRQELEASIASDRGIRAAIQEALRDELAQTMALKNSVDELTRTMESSNESFTNLQSFVNEFCDLMRGELHQVQRRMDDIERNQRWTRRTSDPDGDT